MSGSTGDQTYRYCMAGRKGKKLYAYLTNGLPVQVGDKVWVPFGKEERPIEVKVFAVMDCTRETAPWPPEQTKAVLRISDPSTDGEQRARNAEEREEQRHDGLCTTPMTTAQDAEAGEEEPQPAPAEPEPEAAPQAGEDLTQTAKGAKRSAFRWKILLCAAVCCVLAVGVFVTVGRIEDRMIETQYRQAEEYLAAGDLNAAKAELRNIPGSYQEAGEMTRYIDLCKTAESGTEKDYKTALDGLERIGAEHDGVLGTAARDAYDRLYPAYQDLLYQTGWGFLKGGKYRAAKFYFSQIPDYPYAAELLCYARAAEQGRSSSVVQLESQLRALEEIPADYSGPFAEEIAALRVTITDRIAEVKAGEKEQQTEEKSDTAAMKASGLPYVGMPESKVNSTRQLGKTNFINEYSVYGYDGTWTAYVWHNADGDVVFIARCWNGTVVSADKCTDSCWSGNKLVEKPQKPKPGSTAITQDDGAGGGHSLREDYSDPEDLYEDGGYDDLDEAWDEWEEGW